MKELHVNVYQTPQLGTMYVYNHKLSTYTCKLTNNNVKEVELENTNIASKNSCCIQCSI